jgi:hypothetical protein
MLSHSNSLCSLFYKFVVLVLLEVWTNTYLTSATTSFLAKAKRIIQRDNLRGFHLFNTLQTTMNMIPERLKCHVKYQAFGKAWSLIKDFNIPMNEVRGLTALMVKWPSHPRSRGWEGDWGRGRPLLRQISKRLELFV